MTDAEFQINILRHQDTLLRFALKLTSSSDDAQDLLQDTLLKALTKKERLSNNSNLRAWLFIIMRNIFINSYRNKQCHQNAIDYISYVNFNEEVSFTEDMIHAKEIKGIINSFSDKLRHPFLLYLDGYQYGEIAKRLNKPIGTIKSSIHHARKKFHTEYNEYNLVSA